MFNMYLAVFFAFATFSAFDVFTEHFKQRKAR